MNWWDDGPTEAEMLEAAEQCRIDRGLQAEAVKQALVENACDCWARLGQHMVSRAVTVAEVIDEAGEPHLLVIADPEQAEWDTLGLLGTAIAEL